MQTLCFDLCFELIEVIDIYLILVPEPITFLRFVYTFPLT